MRTIPFNQLADEDPHLAEVLWDRQGLNARNTKGWHVLLLDQDPHADHNGAWRHVTVALLLTQPLEGKVVGVGVAIKSPKDDERPDVGQAIALTRAVQDAVSE